MELSLVSSFPTPPLRRVRRRKVALVTRANKGPATSLLSSTTLVQLSIGVFALGFVDAGYSGDWSRIGVLSKESEAVIRDAAFAVVPLCLGVIAWINKTDKS